MAAAGNQKRGKNMATITGQKITALLRRIAAKDGRGKAMAMAPEIIVGITPEHAAAILDGRAELRGMGGTMTYAPVSLGRCFAFQGCTRDAVTTVHNPVDGGQFPACETCRDTYIRG
jgi:hypothetical protein